MFKDILVHIPTERPMRPVIDASISLVSASGAHLDAFAAGYVSASAGYVGAGSVAVPIAAVFETEQERAEERATTALSVFEAEVRHSGIAYECRSIADFPAETAFLLSTAARPHDLSVVLQPDAKHHTFDYTITTEILVQSGGPVLFVPYIHRGAFRAKRIGICWDGSRLAARALRDARPLLAQADSVVAISIDGAESAPPGASPDQLAKHLARVRLPVKLIDVPASRSDIGPSIPSLAADENLDMLVMGAYGHSQLREGFLGGVTRQMLQTMTIPTLTSH